MLSTTYSGNNASANRYFVYDSATVNGQSMVNAKGRIADAYTGTSATGTKLTDEGFSYSPRGEMANYYQSSTNSGGYYSIPITYWANGLIQTFGPFLSQDEIGYTPDGEGRAGGVYDYSITAYTVPSISYYAPTTNLPTGNQPTQIQTSCSGTTCYPITYQYDQNTLRMTQYSVALNGGTISGSLNWNADWSLQQLQIADPFNAADVQTCNYTADDLNRLASVNCLNGSTNVWNQTFSYDPFGNLTKQVPVGGTGVAWMPGYSSATNQYTLGSTSYDADGNVLNDSFNKYTWDAEGKMLSTAYSEGSGETWTFTHDAFGHTVETAINGAYSISNINVGNFKLTAVGQSANYSEYPFPGGSFASEGGGGTGVQLADWLGTSRAFWSTTGGGYIKSGAHAPFGEWYANSGYPLDFTGQESDDNASNTTYYFPERQYRSSQGRWLSPDPAGLEAADPSNPQSWNRYAYAINNPLRYIDPTGLDWCADIEGNAIADDAGGDNSVNCANAGGSWQQVQDPNEVANVNTDVSKVPTFQDDYYFLQLWRSGTGPSTINYGPNDGMTKQLAGTRTFNKIRQKYTSQGCPNSGKPMGTDHTGPWLEGFGTGNSALIQVGGFVAYGQTSGNTTTFTAVNVAGMASFAGETTWAPYINSGADAASNLMPELGEIYIAPNSMDNPNGPAGPYHNITQTFTWSESNLCKQGG